MTPRVEIARMKHLPTLLRILWAFTRKTDWLPVRRSRLTDIRILFTLLREQRVRMISHAGRPVAFLAREGARVHALYVHPEARGLGYGQALLRDAQRTGWLELWTHAANTDARAFYAKAGFLEVASGNMNDERMPDVQLIWQEGGQA